MKRLSVIILILVLLIAGCTHNSKSASIDKNADGNEISKKESENQSKNEETKIDRFEYLTGEIIADGHYGYSSGNIGVIYFVPDKESKQIMDEKYKPGESYMLCYKDVSKTAGLPSELGIYKVRVKIGEADKNNFLYFETIELTDNIGTVAYEGKTYETNQIDYDVKVKDRVCGLIVQWVSKVDSGIIVRFAGEIETEGYYTAAYDEMYGTNIGTIYPDEESYSNIPNFNGEKGFNHFLFSKDDVLINELGNFSSLGRGRFKNSNYTLVYDIGMGRAPSDNLTEIVSLDENYNNMFKYDKKKYMGIREMSEDFLIVTSSNYDGNSNHISTDYYYINKHNTSKVLLFSSEKYSYGLRVISSENEFILSSSEDADQSIVCRITEQGAVTEEIDSLSIDSDKMNEGGKSFNMQGFISDIKIDGAKVIISIKDVKMKEEDSLAFGKTLNKDDLIDIFIIDSNKSGPAIKAGDKVMVSCRYTKDNEILYTIGADIRSYEY